MTHLSRSPIDAELALEQWHGYVEAFRAHGWVVAEIEPADEHPDGVFVEDTVVVFGDLAVLTSPGAASRVGELASTERALTALIAAGLVAPEFQVTNEPSVIAYINYMQTLIQSGTGDVRADYTSILTRAGDSTALIGEINTVLAAGQLSAATISTIRGAVDSIATTTPALLINRVYTAILLTMASTDFIAIK